MNHLRNDLLKMIFLFFVLFITVALLHDHYQRGYSGTDRALNATVFIEKALKRIPICTHDDRTRQRALLYTLQTWTHLAHVYPIRYWISHKTLNSYVQYDNLASYDPDIDVSIMADDVPRLIRLAEMNLSSDYEFEIPPQWYLARIFQHSFKTNLFKYKARFTNRLSNVSINIWPSFNSHSNTDLRTLIEDVTSIHWIFPLELCIFGGVRVWCPAQAEKLVASIYRQTVNDVICFNGRWMS